MTPEFIVLVSATVIALVGVVAGYWAGKSAAAHKRELLDAELKDCKDSAELKTVKFNHLSDELNAVRAHESKKEIACTETCDKLRDELATQTSYALDYAAKVNMLEKQLAGRDEIATASEALLRDELDRIKNTNAELEDILRDEKQRNMADFGLSKLVQPADKKPKKKAKSRT